MKNVLSDTDLIKPRFPKFTTLRELQSWYNGIGQSFFISRVKIVEEIIKRVHIICYLKYPFAARLSLCTPTTNVQPDATTTIQVVSFLVQHNHFPHSKIDVNALISYVQL